MWRPDSRSDRVAQIVQVEMAEWRQAPGGGRAAIVEGTEDVHAVGCFQEDDLQAQRLVVRPASGSCDRNAFSDCVGRSRNAPAARAYAKAQRIVGLIQRDLQSRTGALHSDGGQRRLRLGVILGGCQLERLAQPGLPIGWLLVSLVGSQLEPAESRREL